MGQENANIAAMLQAAGVWNQAEGQNTRRKTSEASSWDSSYDDSADVAAAASRYSADRNYAAGQNANAAGSKLYDDAVASYKKLGYSDADARLKAMQLDNTAAPKDFTSDANSMAAPKILSIAQVNLVLIQVELLTILTALLFIRVALGNRRFKI